MACVINDEVITLPTEVYSYWTSVAPGYLAILSIDTDGNSGGNIYFFLISGDTATTYTINSLSPSMTPPCKAGAVSLGNIWYDIGAGAFFYTYGYAMYESADCSSTYTSSIQVYIGGHYVNGTPYWVTPGLPLSAITASTTIQTRSPTSYIRGGGDKWLNSSNIYVVYKDMFASPPVIYYSKTVKDPSTTAGGTF